MGAHAGYLSLASSQAGADRQKTIDGDPAWITERTVPAPDIVWLEAVVIHGDRALDISLAAPPDGRDALGQPSSSISRGTPRARGR